MSVVDKSNSEHYLWGNGCEGWHLLKSEELSVIQERVPAGEKEDRHYHNKAQQFFYVLSGVAELEVSGTKHLIKSGSGLNVPQGHPHQLINNGSADLHFLVISQPKSHGDRVQTT